MLHLTLPSPVHYHLCVQVATLQWLQLCMKLLRWFYACYQLLHLHIPVAMAVARCMTANMYTHTNTNDGALCSVHHVHAIDSSGLLADALSGPVL